MPDPEDPRPTTFRLLAVPGVTVDKWTRTWSERRPEVDLQVEPTAAAEAATVLAAGADAGLLRTPVDQDVFHAIPLYTEVTVVVVQRDHLLSAGDDLTVADLADEQLLRPLDDVIDWTGVPAAPAVAEHRPATTADAVELVAAGVGVLVVPQSLARAHQRRDVTYRVLTDAPTSSVALVWPRDRYTELVEEMIGIVRGRTANSTRGRAQQPAEPPARPAAKGAPRATPASGRTPARRGGPSPRTSPKRRGR
ncbi:LysR substrate-binding domain-containing protein [Catellatospora vulcania]|uniref:LysR substrate-binding domain-containing protein n=1 Tax=Catellatospora vulcania TaxID=1460450 RepID=UPI0012D41927|nr:LysR substrate-binding domain-containing protein [Catellatospora vulcania]